MRLSISWGPCSLAVGLLAAGKSLPRASSSLLAVLVLWGVLNIGGIFDHRRWALPSELVRLPVTAAALAWVLPDGLGYVAAGVDARACIVVVHAGAVSSLS